ncbi:MAG TPA: GAF domain-containing protein [Gemmatimonadaceae bacterium]|jgi:GAF domain-containing protein|nr:GAF domain-containing protein [Gemmatimonadaceae bacterium]
MAETQLDVRGLGKTEGYRALRSQFDALCEGVSDQIALMSTMACVLHFGFGHLWTGFYRRVDERRLMVGPFQGTIGCLEIEIGKGVCGTAAATRQTVTVPDVNTFEGHITCDSRSRSEIVVPVFDRKGELIAVFDIDSEFIGSFDEEDREQLESWMEWFAR